MRHKISQKIGTILPERRIFLRSDTDTRFIRLTPGGQLVAISGVAVFVAWSIIATSILILDAIGSGSVRNQAQREQLLYENRLQALSEERDELAGESELSHERFNSALNQVSQMQLSLLASEERRREMEKGLEAVHKALRRSIRERDQAEQELVALRAPQPDAANDPHAAVELADTVDYLTVALGQVAEERDRYATLKQQAELYVEELELEQDLIFERNDRIFSQLEDAVSMSMAPLDEMFKAAGMSPQRVLDSVRAGYSGQGGPMMPLTFSTKAEQPDPDSLRANAVLDRLDQMNMYRIAAEKVPFDLPVKGAFRHTSGFGPRWGRAHEGTDMAASYGTAINATADGVVVHAGWSSGYGRLIKIRHDFGIETRYAHLSKIRVSVGQRVSRGDRIGDMGNSGRSTGTHLHYEIRENGKAVNPMKFIKAGQNVF